MSDGLFGGAFGSTRVLVTGHTGFKGSWLSRWLLDMGAEITGLALEPETDPALFDELRLADHLAHRLGDIRSLETVKAAFSAAKPEIVFHLAAQPLVRRSYDEPLYTFETNIMGTGNVLEAARTCPETRAIVVITTDKVYENPETGHPFTEEQPLGGSDPYSASKAGAEIVSASYRSSFFGAPGSAAIATARAGNVIGGGDWSKDRIIPDCVRALEAGESIVVRNPASVRPWEHVVEPLSGYLHLGSMLLREGAEYAEAFNFGPDPSKTYTVEDVVNRAVAAWGGGSWHRPDLGAQPHEASLLQLDVDKAEERLGWKPAWDFDVTVDRTIGWYRRYADDATCADEATIEDIRAYVAAGSAAGAPWA